MNTLEITIDSLSYGSAGVGRVGGIVYFVPFSCPGDRLEIKVTKTEKRYREAEIVRIIEPSADRIKPPCPYYGVCGGCQWQQVSYPLQLKGKERELRMNLSKARLSEIEEKVKTCVPSPKELAYRRTARFKVVKNPDTGKPEAGFYQAASYNLVKVEKCLLLNEALNSSLKDIDITKPGLVGFDLFYDETDKVVPFYRFSEKDQGADFFQVNGEVNEAMMEYLKKTVAEKIDGKPRILDIYCGDGNLSLQMAGEAAAITGWDNSKTAIARGNMRAEALKESGERCKIKFYEADVDKSWKFISGYAREADCIIIDPPRKGLKNQTARLAGLKVPLIIYVSCAPPALARDLAAFVEAGYEIEEIQPFDMFPQTYHLETVTVLRRK
ncbi:MAG: class I SAM-dependent RNA methyltransferase [Spirochaetales bacterium]|nr:class I SAM-dependent RNA methyltransferase [Spirochaetales bacterium]